MPSPVTEWVVGEFGLRTRRLDRLGWRYAPESDRIYIPTIGPEGQFRGSILRQWKNPLTPKNLVYKEIRDESFMNWMPQKPGQPIVVVEDAISAAKVYQADLNAVSLCGTHLSHNMVRELRSKTDEIYLALDKDAYEKAIKLVGTFRQLIGLKVWKLEQDLKYEKEERIREAYYGKATDFSRP